MRPQFLKEGDTVAVIAIASAPSQEQLAANWKEQLESWGLKVKVGKNITATSRGRSFLILQVPAIFTAQAAGRQSMATS